MSRCAHGYPSANSFRNIAAVIAPAGRPPEFLMSATSDLMSSLYSSQSGSGHAGSPARLPAARISAISASSVPKTPRRGVAERDHASTGERRRVDHDVGLEALRIGQTSRRGRAVLPRRC